MYNVAGRPKTKNRWFKAQRFIDLRVGRGYDTQEALSARIGIGQRLISNWETNLTDPSADQLVKLSKFFNVSIDYLLGQSTDPTIHQLIEDNRTLQERLSEFVTPENAPELLKRIAAFLEGED